MDRRTIGVVPGWQAPGRGDRRRAAVEQSDAADEARLEPSGSIMVGAADGCHREPGKVVRPSQLIRVFGGPWRVQTSERVVDAVPAYDELHGVTQLLAEQRFSQLAWP